MVKLRILPQRFLNNFCNLPKYGQKYYWLETDV